MTTFPSLLRPLTDGRGAGARRLLVLPAMVVVLSASRGGAAPVHAQSTPVVVRNGGIGVAHVDVMELHVARRPDAPPAPVEALGAADLADRFEVAVASGAAWHRWSLYWDLSDRGGTFEWTVGDGIASRDVAYGLRSLVVLHGNPPGVARLEGAPPDIEQPVFLAADGTPTDDPSAAARVSDANPWARFVAAAVARYRPGGAIATARGWADGAGVRHWQIGNEPNSPDFWRGTPAEYVRYLEVAYLAAKWVDPGAVIAHAGIANDANAEAWFGAFLDALRARAADSPLPERYGYYYDRTAWHWYTAPSNLTVAPPGRVRQMHAERGLPEKPLWVTEFGAPLWSEYPGPCWDPASPGRVTLAEQSAFVWQSLAEGLAARAELMVYFQLYDDCGNGHQSYDAFGLVRNHAANQCWTEPGQGCWRFDSALAGTTRPSYDAFRTAARELSGATVREASAPAPGWRRVVFSRPGGTRVTMAWNTTYRDRSVELAAAAGQATLFELDGDGLVRTRVVRPEAGGYRVFLSGATNRNGRTHAPIAAGRPVLLVESGLPAEAAGTGAAAPGAPSGPVTGGSAAGAVSAVAAPGDRTPPVIALVGTLPEVSETLFELQVIASDEASGLGAFQVLYAIDAAPTSPEGWSTYVAPLPWPGSPQTGDVRLPFVAAPGRTYYFAARAADLAGNWTETPAYVHTQTRIVGAARATARTHVEPIQARRDGIAH